MEKSIPLLDRELDKLIEYYSEQPQERVCLLLRYHLQDFFLPVDGSFRYCLEIDDPLECYDASGKYAPCHGFTEFTMGSEAKAAEYKKKKTSDFVFTEENICYGCKLIRFCRICFAANHMLTGNMQKQSPEICIFNRMCLKAGVQIQMNRSKLFDYDSAYIMQLNEAAHAINKYLEEMGDGE